MKGPRGPGKKLRRKKLSSEECEAPAARGASTNKDMDSKPPSPQQQKLPTPGDAPNRVLVPEAMKGPRPGKKQSSAMNKRKKLSSEECEAPAEAWINGSNGTVNRTEERIANLTQMLEQNRESQEHNQQAVNGLQTQIRFLQEQLVHLEATEKSLKAQEEILKRQSSDLEGKISHTK
jgi:hypothetical protein